MSVLVPPGVKRTSGATFDPDDQRVYFIATGEYVPEYPYLLIAVNELDSPAALDQFKRAADSGARVFLDSGIFNLAMTHARKHGVSHDVGLSMPPEEIDGFDRLWDMYGQITTTYTDRLWGVVELDQGGVEHKPRTRAKIETEFGITPIPVYHPLLDGWGYYDDLARGYDRICFGNLVKASQPVRLRLAYTASERARGYPYLWTHMLGMTPNQATLSMPMRGSYDSSSWITALRWAPSWKAFTMLTACANYPPPMWSCVRTDVIDADHRERITKVLIANALSVLRTLNDYPER